MHQSGRVLPFQLIVDGLLWSTEKDEGRAKNYLLRRVLR